MENASSAKEINPDRSNGSSSDAIDSEEESVNLILFPSSKLNFKNYD